MCVEGGGGGGDAAAGIQGWGDGTGGGEQSSPLPTGGIHVPLRVHQWTFAPGAPVLEALMEFVFPRPLKAIGVFSLVGRGAFRPRRFKAKSIYLSRVAWLPRRGAAIFFGDVLPVESSEQRIFLFTSFWCNFKILKTHPLM